MFGFSSVQSTMSTMQQRYAALQNTVAQLQVSTEPPKEGPGFDGMDADGDGGVSYDEFWAAAQEKRDAGTLSLRAIYERTNVRAASIETSSVRREDALIARLEGRHGHGRGHYGFDAAAEFKRAMSAISFAAGEKTEIASSEAKWSSLEVSVEKNGGPAPTDEATADLRARALAAVDGPVETGIPSLDPYERATQNVFAVADADDDGQISRDEFNAMKNALYGEGRTVGTTITLTATQGYAQSLTANSVSYATLGASAWMRA